MKTCICRVAPLTPLLLAVCSLVVSATSHWAQDPKRFEADIQAFERADALRPPPFSPVLFTGSSSIRLWSDLSESFPHHPVLNRGFGGSHMSDLVYFFDRVITIYSPSLVVVYEGDNDLAGQKSISEVLADYREFVNRARLRIPEARLVFLAVKPSPSRLACLESQRALNITLANMAEADPSIEFVDLFNPMLGRDGLPMRNLFQKDMLHINTDGYALWTLLIRPVIDRSRFLDVGNNHSTPQHLILH